MLVKLVEILLEVSKKSNSCLNRIYTNLINKKIDKINKKTIKGKVKEILISASSNEPLYPITKASFIKGKGITGDRYYMGKGTFSKKLESQEDFHVTLIEQEEIDAFNKVSNLNYENEVFRRNIVTENIRLNDLVGKEFVIGDVKFLGMRLCEPCKFLSDKTSDKFLKLMKHKAGLRAKIVSSGTVFINDTINQGE